MLLARDSRHHRRGSKLIFWIGWQELCASSLRSPRGSASGKPTGAAIGMVPPRLIGALTNGAKPPDRRAWLVKRDISAWRLGLVVCVLLVFLWVGWRIIAQTAALSFVQSHPDAALSLVADQPVALIRRAQLELAEPDGNLDSARDMGAACSALKPAECPSVQPCSV